MVHSCIVCGIKWGESPNISFHKFPVNEKLRNKWLKAIGRISTTVMTHKRVCSGHFAKNDYELNRNKMPQLIKGSIPSRNLPSTKPEDVFSEFLEEFNHNFEEIPNALGLSRKSLAFQEEEINVPYTSSLKRNRNCPTTTSMDLQEEAISSNTNIKVLINQNEKEPETIIIEVTSDKEEEEEASDDNNVENICIEVVEEETGIDQLPNSTPSAITMNCKNQGCDFKCKDLNLIVKHSQTCRHKSRQKHKTERKIWPWYKCCRCNSILKHLKNLDTHTKFHAREEGDLFLKVRFKKYFKGEFQGYKVKTATSDKHNSAIKNNQTIDCPELDYNPDEAVFECDECNFKTNEAGDLEKHQKLHWNPKKNEMFKTNKWFVCNICYFYSFDKQRYLEHYQTHVGDLRNKIVPLS